MKEKHKRIVLRLISRPKYYNYKSGNLEFRRELDRCLVDCVLVLILQLSYHIFDNPYKAGEFDKYMNDIRERHPIFQFMFHIGLVTVYYESVKLFELGYSNKQISHFAFIGE